jgi:hypothetical protein
MSMAETDRFPQDADGEELRRLAADGSDLSQPMTLDFTVVASSEAAAREIATGSEALGFDPSIYQDPDRGAWTVTCSRSMLATHAAVTAARAQLDELGRPFGARCDGWGSFGH